MNLRVLSEAQVKGLATMREAIDVQREAFALQARGVSAPGLVRWLDREAETPSCLVGFLPAFLGGGRGFGVKIVSDFYGRRDPATPHMAATVLVCDGTTGAPRAVISAGHLTDLRTGAATGLAVDLLARRDARVAAIFGAGRVARNQAEALCEVRDVETIWVCGRTESRLQAYTADLRARGGRIPGDVRIARSTRDAVAAADVVITATTARAPVFDGRALRPGTCVVTAGAHREVDSETLRRAGKIVADMREAVAWAPVFTVPLGEGVVQEADIAELGELVLGLRPGRESPEEITFCNTQGVPVQDLVTAQYVLRKAEERNIGTVIPLL